MKNRTTFLLTLLLMISSLLKAEVEEPRTYVAHEKFDDLFYVLSLEEDGTGSFMEIFFHDLETARRQSKIAWKETKEKLEVRLVSEDEKPIISKVMILKSRNDGYKLDLGHGRYLEFKKDVANKSAHTTSAIAPR